MNQFNVCKSSKIRQVYNFVNEKRTKKRLTELDLVLSIMKRRSV